MTPLKFLGAEVKNASLSGGNSGQASTLTLDLVDDPESGESFAPPNAWQAATFEAGALRFRGLVQHRSARIDEGAASVHRVILVEPRSVLEGVSVVVGEILEPVDVPNLLNVYGYWEDRFGFGGGLVDEMGMLWDGRWPDLHLVPGGGLVPEDAETADPIGLRPGLEILANGDSPYSGGIRFRGRRYRLDLSGLPKAPEPFRIGGGPVLTLAQILDELCDAAGCDYRVDLGDDDVLRFVKSDRNRPQAPGAVARWVGSRPERPKALSIGVEMASEATHARIYGGRVRRLNQVVAGDSDAIWPYWGLARDGTAIRGTGYPEREEHRFVVPCDEVADVVGQADYPCSIAELRAAAVDLDSWAAYLVRNEPEKAEAIDLASVVDSRGDLADLFGELMLQRDLLADDRETAEAFGAMNENEYWSRRVQRLYDFVQKLARENLGRKFTVRMPFPIYEKVVPGRFDRVATDELTDGGWMPEQGAPLGLPYDQVDPFLTDAGLFGCFVAFPYDDRMDLSAADPGSVVAANGAVWVRAEAERFVSVPGDHLPHAVINLSEPLFAAPSDPLGGLEDVAELLKIPVEQVRSAAGLRTGSFPVRVAPAPYRPRAAAIPTVSNRERYSHERWRSGDGTQGRVEVVVDEDLTPWTCGDVDSMVAAGEAVVKSMASRLMEVETASVTIVGLPEKSLGEALVEGGPALTGVDISLGAGGIETSYEMRTYTPVRGAFGRQYADRLKRMGSNARLLRRNARTALRESRRSEETRSRAYAGLMQNASRAVSQRSPHECLAGLMLRDGAAGPYRTAVAALSPQELMANMRADSPDYIDVAGMGMEGLLRPFSADFDVPDAPEGGEEQEGSEGGSPRRTSLPHFQRPHESPGDVDRILPTTEDLNPFEDSDVDLMVAGDEYVGGLHRKKPPGEGPVDRSKARPLALRGPLALEGFGLELTGKPVPNAGDENAPVQEWSDEFLEDYKLHPERWKAGLIGNVMWCEWTGTWLAAGTILEGRAEESIQKGEVGVVKIRLTEDGDFSDEAAEARNGMSQTIPQGSTVYLGYNALFNRWTVIGADCPAG